MPKTIEAIYKEGVLHPLNPIKGLKKNQTVAITIENPLKKNILSRDYAGYSLMKMPKKC